MLKIIKEEGLDIYLNYYISKLNPLTNYDSTFSFKELIYSLYIIFEDFRYDPCSYLILSSSYLKLEAELTLKEKEEYLEYGEDVFTQYKNKHLKELSLYKDWLKEKSIVDVFKVYNLILPKKTTINRLLRKIEEYYLTDQNLSINNNLILNKEYLNNKLIKLNIFKSFLNELLKNKKITIIEKEKIEKELIKYGSRNNKS